GDKHAAGQISCRDKGQYLQGLQSIDPELKPAAGQIKHVRHYMLKPAEYKGGDKKPHIEDLGKRAVFISGANKNGKGHKEAAEHSQNKQAQRPVLEFCLADP